MTTVVITGSNRGIGLELVRRHRERGDEVVALCRSASAELSSLGVEVIDHTDVADGASLDRVGERLSGRVVDRIVANAGVRHVDSLDTLDFDSMRLQFEVNTLGPLRLVRALRGCLIRGSNVVLVSSRVGSIGDNHSGGNFGYRMSKAALNMAGRNLALALRSDGIGVFLVHPGFVRTQLTGGMGNVDPPDAAARIIALADRLALEQTGTFWHVEGRVELPW